MVAFGASKKRVNHVRGLQMLSLDVAILLRPIIVSYIVKIGELSLLKHEKVFCVLKSKTQEKVSNFFDCLKMF